MRGDYDRVLERLRRELAKAEEGFREAATEEAKQQARDHFELALSRFSRLVIHGELPEPN
jgi:hypothetical protein